MQISTNTGAPNSLAVVKTHTNTTLTTPSFMQVSNAGYYYFLEGQVGLDPVIVKRDPTGFAMTSLATYSFGHANMFQFAIVGNYIVIATNSTNTFYVYTLDTTTLYDSFTLSYQIGSLCSVDNDHILAFATMQPQVGGVIESVITMRDLTAKSYISNYTITDSLGSNEQVVSMCANPSDTTGGGNAIIVGFEYQAFSGTSSQIQVLRYNAGYSSVSSILTPFSQELSNIINVSCVGNAGLVSYYYSSFGSTEFGILTSSSNYEATGTYGIQPTAPVNQNFAFFAPTIDLTTTWAAINSGAVESKSVAVSRTTTNQLYTIEKTSNTTYTGFLLSNTITLAQMTPYAGQTYNFVATTINTNPTLNTTLNSYSVSSQTSLGSVYLTNQTITTIAKNEINQVQSGFGEFLVPTNSSTKVTSYSPALLNNYSLPLAGETCIFAKNGEDIDAGAQDIYSYSVLINAINVAFLEAFNRLKVGNPSPPAEAPTISLDYQTKLCTLTYSGEYSASLNNGIFFNQPLLSLITFYPNIPSTIQSLPNLFQIVLPLNSTSLTQTSGTIYQFNQLLRIGLQSNTIFVGDSYFGNNQTNRIITDIDVPTDTLLENTGNLYYQPTFMRPYNLLSTNAIERIQMDILYLYKDFSSYPLLLNPDSCWTVKLDFVRKQ